MSGREPDVEALLSGGRHDAYALQHSWDGPRVASFITADLISASTRVFDRLEPSLRVRLLLSLMSVPAAVRNSLPADQLRELLKLALSESADEWTRSVASILSPLIDPSSSGSSSRRIDSGAQSIRDTVAAVRARVQGAPQPRPSALGCAPFESAFLSASSPSEKHNLFRVKERQKPKMSVTAHSTPLLSRQPSASQQVTPSSSSSNLMQSASMKEPTDAETRKSEGSGSGSGSRLGFGYGHGTSAVKRPMAPIVPKTETKKLRAISLEEINTLDSKAHEEKLHRAKRRETGVTVTTASGSGGGTTATGGTTTPQQQTTAAVSSVAAAAPPKPKRTKRTKPKEEKNHQQQQQQQPQQSTATVAPPLASVASPPMAQAQVVSVTRAPPKVIAPQLQSQLPPSSLSSPTLLPSASAAAGVVPTSLLGNPAVGGPTTVPERQSILLALQQRQLQQQMAVQQQKQLLAQAQQQMLLQQQQQKRPPAPSAQQMATTAAATAAAAAAAANSAVLASANQALQQLQTEPSNQLTAENRALIRKFLTGSRENPNPAVPVLQVLINSELKTMEDRTTVTESIVFEINYDKGTWRKIRKRVKADPNAAPVATATPAPAVGAAPSQGSVATKQ